MKKRGIINAQLAGLIAGLGHKDTFMIGDGGMPIPKGVEIEQYTIANEIEEKNPELLAYIREKLPNAEWNMVPHTELKEMSRNVKFAVRTGEFTPYPNIILRAGVAFPA